MLQRDAKDWKVHIHSLLLVARTPPTASGVLKEALAYLQFTSRTKTTMLSSAYPNIAGKLQNNKSRQRTGRKSSVTTQTKKQPPAPPKTTPFSNAYRKPPNSFSTPSNAANMIPSTKQRTKNHQPRSKRRKAITSSYGALFSVAKAASVKLSPSPN